VLAHSESQLQTTPQTNGAARAARPAPRTDTPYVRGRTEFDSVFGDLAKGKRNWQLIAFASLTVAFVLAGGIVALGAVQQNEERNSRAPRTGRE
jgi:type IV secretory pathway TrbF-like protein